MFKYLAVHKKNCIFAAESVQLMINNILKYTFALSLAMTAPVALSASEMAGFEQNALDDEPAISVSQSTVYVTGAVGETLEVVSLTGKSILTVRIETPSQRIDLNISKGCYILKVGKVVRKVFIR